MDPIEIGVVLIVVYLIATSVTGTLTGGISGLGNSLSNSLNNIANKLGNSGGSKSAGSGATPPPGLQFGGLSDPAAAVQAYIAGVYSSIANGTTGLDTSPATFSDTLSPESSQGDFTWTPTAANSGDTSAGSTDSTGVDDYGDDGDGSDGGE